MSQTLLTPPTPTPQRGPTRQNGGQHAAPQHPRRGLLLGPSAQSAIESLRANQSRSLLTMLGVIVGVAAVLVAVTLTQGASVAVTQRVSTLGSNTLFITPGAGNAKGGSGQQGGIRVGGAGSGEGALNTGASIQSLTQGDADAITHVAHVTLVTPILSSKAQVVIGSANTNTNVSGVYPAEQQIGSWSLAQGSWFSAADERSAQPVAVLGSTVSADLFSGASASPVGETIFISGQPFRVVGVLQTKGALGASNQDDAIYIPFLTMTSRLNNSAFVNSIEAQVDDASNVTATQNAIQSLLEQRHQIKTGQADDFRINSSNQIAATVQQNIGTLTLLLVGIAAISLIVGGIGIMNIMLVSVTERTREIGVRMALGARRSDIRNQFLIEAVALSVVGGALGIIIGLAGGFALTTLVGLPFAVSYGWVALAFGVAAAVGVVFGLYPADQAARLDPIVALRTE
ncbi:MAG TPA: ABC transporter permease [Ktedonobacterales bacterium]|nr:ABC transporter permease [Ktedonobacterales bacterium]